MRSTSIVVFVVVSILFSQGAHAQWTSVSLPESLKGAAIETTAPVNARCSQVSQAGDQRTCADSALTPSFHVSQSGSEVLQTLPPGTSLKVLEAQRDPDGFALRVQDGSGSTFWVFESNGNSSARLNGRNLNQILSEVVVAGAVTAVQSTTTASTHPSIQPPCNCEGPQTAATHVPQIPDFNSETDSGVGFYSLCSAFIKDTGEYGPLGEHLIDELKRDHRSDLYSNEVVLRLQGMNNLCPNFSQFTNAQKERFWVWTFMAIAHVESKCGKYNKGKEPGPSGHYPWGILQMERLDEGLDGTRSQWAGNPNEELACSAPDISSHDANIACGLDALLSYIRGYHTTACSIQEVPGGVPIIRTPENCPTVPLGGIYWQKMRTLNGDISRRIKTFAACGAQ